MRVLCVKGNLLHPLLKAQLCCSSQAALAVTPSSVSVIGAAPFLEPQPVSLWIGELEGPF